MKRIFKADLAVAVHNMKVQKLPFGIGKKVEICFSGFISDAPHCARHTIILKVNKIK